jgi:hypothetical protein
VIVIVSMVVDRRSGDVVPDEQQHRLEQIQHRTLGCRPRSQSRRDPREDQNEENRREAEIKSDKPPHHEG